MEYSAIKVVIGKKPNGHCKYPDFSQLKCVKDSKEDWSKYIDVNGLGWQYDKLAGHDEELPDSPIGTWLGMIVVDDTFCKEAVAMFPDEVTKLTEAEAEDFWDNRAHIKEPDERIDEKVITAIKMKQDMGIELTANQVKALDPTDDTPGISKNHNKKWADMKIKKAVSIKVDAK